MSLSSVDIIKVMELIQSLAKQGDFKTAERVCKDLQRIIDRFGVHNTCLFLIGQPGMPGTHMHIPPAKYIASINDVFIPRKRHDIQRMVLMFMVMMGDLEIACVSCNGAEVDKCAQDIITWYCGDFKEYIPQIVGPHGPQGMPSPPCTCAQGITQYMLEQTKAYEDYIKEYMHILHEVVPEITVDINDLRGRPGNMGPPCIKCLSS